MSDEKRCTTSGIEIPPLVDETFGVPDPEKIGKPGRYPFTRGVYPTMYRGRPWTMRQYAGFGTATETNARFKYLLERGQTGLSVAFDLATQIGYDSDHPMAAGEVGRTGVAIDSLKDMEQLFAGIPLDKVSTSMTINSTAVVLLCMYIAVGRKQGVPSHKLMGTVQNDILKEFIARGTYIMPPAPSMRIITDIFVYAKDNLPHYNTISISGYHIREAGSTAAQEVAFTLSNAITYVEAALKAGMSIDEFAPRLSFFFASHNNLLEEVAKFRVARRLWAKIVKERFQSTSDKSMMLRFHTQTGGSTLTAQQPENNIIRTTIQALAGVLGGTQSLHTNSYDEALGLPTEKSAEIALRTQQVIAFESGIVDTADPLAGSYYVEYLTDQLEAKVTEIMAEIDRLGGSVRCIETGYFQDELAGAAYDFQRAIEEEKSIVVGVNRFHTGHPEVPQVLKIDPDLERKKIVELKELKASRDSAGVERSMGALRTATESENNLVPYVLDCVEQYVTVGEIADLFRTVWGEYHDHR
jgi:methylmalonyl-CoA mutase N-terminal domain/subunit